ncbi:43634_t:CDS:2 [Gigaspora margarita]|uniref:43634_t:CDS:1 n=1 Tax=Gigaspora margarita TaxID=4874 RepID=A0ABM8W5Y1_GIGMA|nr:43634_t:CDS:2 [Gigaspora margarita]
MITKLENSEDLLSIIIVFVAQHNGLHSTANCKRRKETAQVIQKFQKRSNETSSKQDPQQLIAILFKNWYKSCSERLFLHKIKSAKSLSKQLGYNSHLVINCLGEFYLCMPKPLEKWAENQGTLFSENQEKI